MGAGSHSISGTLGGRSLSRSVSTSADSDTVLGGTAAPITLYAGKTVTDWVKADANTATCNLPAGHGYTSGVFDVYSSAGLIYRYGVTGTIVTNALSLDGGTGDDFPVSATLGIICCKQQQVDVSLDGDNAALVGVMADCNGHVDMQTAASASIRAFSLYADEPDLWDSDQAVNPYTGDPITKAKCSNGTTTDGSLQILISQDSTP